MHEQFLLLVVGNHLDDTKNSNAARVGY